jgi:integrase
MSALSEALARYLSMRRGFGFKLICQGPPAERFRRVHGATEAEIITAKLVLDWATQSGGPRYWLDRLSACRGFARHVSITEPRTEIPPTNILSPTRRRPAYLYSEAQVRSLLEAMLTLPPAEGLRRWTFYCVFGLLAVTGLRVSEALRLKRDDVDLDSGVLTIRDAKFGKSRVVPIHPTTIAVLKDYAKRRDAHRRRLACTYFFTGDQGARIYHQGIHLAFCTVSRRIGLRTPDAAIGPRIHDLRHSYAVSTLLRWYRAGDDVEQRLPQLFTYLGHSHVRDTYWYLSACPELMELAASRLETRWESVS